MKTLYIQCNMGCAGDMLMSALSELLPNKDEFFKKLNEIGLTDVKYESKAVERCGITGTLTDVKIGGKIEESIDMTIITNTIIIIMMNINIVIIMNIAI